MIVQFGAFWPNLQVSLIISREYSQMRQMFFGPRWWKRKLAVYGEAKELLEQEKRVAQEKEERERKQRYEMSEEYEKEAIDIWEIKKRRRKKKRR